MSKIHEVGGGPTKVDGTPIDRHQHHHDTMQQVLPSYSALEVAHRAFADVDEMALQETIEEMSLSLGSQIRDRKRKEEGQGVHGHPELESLVALVQQIEDESLQIYMRKFQQLAHDEKNPLTLLQKGNVPIGAMIAILARFLGDHSVATQQRRRLQDTLQSLLQNEQDWELQLFAFLELGSIPQPAMAQLRAIYQRQAKGEQPQGLSRWFAEVQAWPDRRKRIQVLIRALAFDLSQQGGVNQQSRLAATISDLKRLLLFLGLEEYSCSIAQAIGLSSEQILSEVLLFIEQQWLSPEWVMERLHRLALPELYQIHYIHRMQELLQLLPDPCFEDAAQKEHIVATLLQLQDRLNESEHIA